MDGSWPLSVAVAPPGAGKSTQARRAIAALTRTGTLRRVVWMTPGTLSRNGVASLADEARADFLACGVPATVIYGRAHFTRLNPDAVGEKRHSGRTFQTQYLEQFTWPQGPSVKLMSHAHLPVLYGAGIAPPGAAARLEVPDLVVIDEDPGGSLIRSSPG
ncbi:hypothetical protein [Deinococcus yunweiensis]|uniref:hypothetical protein n=1 Tax=Deinococcus yunweiensis TaxID=367282 RepID=UPI00398F252C